MLGLLRKIMPVRVKTKLLSTLGLLISLLIIIPVGFFCKSTIDNATSRIEQALRLTIVQIRNKLVNETKKDAVGVEMGNAGLSIRAIVPVKYLNKKTCWYGGIWLSS